MNYWEIELQNIGRGKVCRKVTVTGETLEGVEQLALRECKKHLMSRDVEILSGGDLTYTVAAGFHDVGKIKIRTIPGKDRVKI